MDNSPKLVPICLFPAVGMDRLRYLHLHQDMTNHYSIWVEHKTKHVTLGTVDCYNLKLRFANQRFPLTQRQSLGQEEVFSEAMFFSSFQEQKPLRKEMR